MSNLNKVLFVVFFILLVVTGAELFYFFFYQPSKKNAPLTTNAIIPTPCLTCQKPVSGTANKNPAIDPSNIAYLQSLEKRKWNYYLLQEVSGKVADLKIDQNKDIISYNLVDDDNKLIEKFTGSINSPKDMRYIYIKKDGNLTLTNSQVAFSNMKDGNKIKITRHYDLNMPDSNSFLFNEIIISQQVYEKKI